MQSIYELLSEQAQQLLSDTKDLLDNHSVLSRLQMPRIEGVAVLPRGSHKWGEMEVDGQRLLSKIRDDYERFVALIQTLIKGVPKNLMRNFSNSDKDIRKILEQGGATWVSSTADAFSRLSNGIHVMLDIVNGLYDRSDSAVLLVPDTNALLYNPDLEDWDVPGVKTFTIVLTPTVLSELDQHKVNHRNEEVRKKADGLIRRIKGYRTRGRLTDGVVLRSGRSSIVTVAAEPSVSDSLPWLDSNNADDRYLASFIEVLRQNPHSSAVLVTRDINLQNKAEFARLPFDEPPEPTTR